MLTKVPNDFSIDLHTDWYIATLVAKGCNDKDFGGFRRTDYVGTR